MDVSELTYETFAPLQGDRFRLNVAEYANIEAELTAVECLPSSGQNSELAPESNPSFYLVFRFPADGPNFNQGVFPLQHDTLGNLEIFLVPIKPDEQGRNYEAVFNRA
ncbi:MAG: hypothetical protein AAGG51_11955 [Cyanobacteria bacterium P01_G01_bin.54]